jgi:hypothetical protein
MRVAVKKGNIAGLFLFGTNRADGRAEQAY